MVCRSVSSLLAINSIASNVSRLDRAGESVVGFMQQLRGVANFVWDQADCGCGVVSALCHTANK